jgi:hypothetical protein
LSSARPERRRGGHRVLVSRYPLPSLQTARGEPDTPQAVHLVCAHELDPPPGEKPIQWILITTLAVTTPEEACQMVRYYAQRWVIERWRFTLKSGC